MCYSARVFRFEEGYTRLSRRVLAARTHPHPLTASHSPVRMFVWHLTQHQWAYAWLPCSLRQALPLAIPPKYMKHNFTVSILRSTCLV
jgi:hypothetical protein